MKRLLLLCLLWPALALAQDAPVVQWTHGGTNVTHFQIQITASHVVDVGKPTPTGNVYEAALPVLPAGTHTLRVRACYGSTTSCEASQPVTVVKMVASGSTALNFYWVSPTGSAAWANCKSDTPPAANNNAAHCALSVANNNATAGDTVWLRGGTYTYTSSSGCGSNYTCGIFPKNRGTAVAPITYRAYANETPVLTTDGTAPSYTYGISVIGASAETPTYIRVFGITVYGLPGWVYLYKYASHNELAYNTFYSDTGTPFNSAAGILVSNYCGTAGQWTCYSKHNWIHDNIVSKVHQGGTVGCVEGADIIRIGSGYPTGDAVADVATENNDYTTVEDNVLRYAGHTVLDTYGGYNVVRGNVSHNEGWIPDYSGGTCTYPTMPNGKYGHRGFQTSEDYGRTSQYVLLESNRVGWSSANPNNPGEGNISLASPATIVRYNVSVGAHQSGITTKWYSGFPDGLLTTLTSDIDASTTTLPVATTAGLTHTYYYVKIDNERMSCTSKDASNFLTCTRGHVSTTPAAHSSGAVVSVNAMANRGQSGGGPSNIRVYHNTSFYNGQTYPYMQSAQDGCSTCPGKLAGLNVYSLALNVKADNNLFYQNYSHTLWSRDVTVNTGQDPASYSDAITVGQNWNTADGDPEFVNASVADPTAMATLPNVSLRATSGAINAGAALTQASGAGNATTTLVVDDAMYFQDGSWGSDLARAAGRMHADWIAIGTVGNVVEIASINYATNTITLATAATWADNASIWLARRSDGVTVLVGAAPDYGAHEYGAGTASAPTGVGVR